MKNKIIIIIGIIILILLMFFNKEWLRLSLIEKLGGYTVKEQVIKIDTIDVRVDTVYYTPKEVTLAVSRLNNRVSELVFKNSDLANKLSLFSFQNNLKNDSILTWTYENLVNDTIISGKIFTRLNSKDCEILEQKFTYKLLKPYSITKTITIEKLIENTLTNKKINRFGIGLSGSTDKEVYGSIGILTKKRFLIQGEYKINKELNIQDININNNQPKIKIGLMYFF